VVLGRGSSITAKKKKKGNGARRTTAPKRKDILQGTGPKKRFAAKKKNARRSLKKIPPGLVDRRPKSSTSEKVKGDALTFQSQGEETFGCVPKGRFFGEGGPSKRAFR